MDSVQKKVLREQRPHGTVEFPLAAYDIGPRLPGTSVLFCHWHSEMELFYVTEGETLFQVGTDYFPVRAGEAVCIDGGEIHAGHAHGNAACSYNAIVFDANLLASSTFDTVQQKYISPLLDRTRTFPRHIKPNSEWEIKVLELLRTLIAQCSLESPGYEIAAKGLLYLMIHTLTTERKLCNRNEKDADSPLQFKIERLKLVISYMQLHYQRPIRIAELAEQIPMSEGQFYRFFKSMTHQTPLEYLNTLRIRKAADLLTQPHAKIANVAMDVGFEHISYFVKIFRDRMQCTPSEFRKRKFTTD